MCIYEIYIYIHVCITYTYTCVCIICIYIIYMYACVCVCVFAACVEVGRRHIHSSIKRTSRRELQQSCNRAARALQQYTV